MINLHPARSLFIRVLLWFFLSIFVLGATLALMLGMGGNARRVPLLQQLVGQSGAARLLMEQLIETPPHKWDDRLSQFARAYDVRIALFAARGNRIAGDDIEIPVEVRDAITRLIRQAIPPRGGMMGRRWEGRQGPPEDRRDAPEAQQHRPPLRMENVDAQALDNMHILPSGDEQDRGRLRYITRTASPRRYWAAMPLMLSEAPPPGSQQGTLREDSRRQRSGVYPAFIVVSSASLSGNGLFFNVWPIAGGAALVILLAAVLWIPLVRSITSPLSRMTSATEEIARGAFDVRLPVGRKDEIGRLGNAINHMAGQIELHLSGQRRFLGDVAHELASPVARMRLSLAILEQQAGQPDPRTMEDLSEEVRHMAALIEEFLSFTRTELRPEQNMREAQTCELLPLIRDVVEREARGRDVRLDVDESLSVHVVEGLLRRALANVIRNAVRYASAHGPIEISAERSTESTARGDARQTVLTVRDHGPGVPEDELPRLFEPFYRPDASRTRASGGAGLGLAIVRTCMQGMGGTVEAKNLTSGGFAVSLTINEQK